MATYGSAEAVEQLLRATTASVFNADQLARIANLLPVVSALIEAETGRTFGGGATNETVVVEGGWRFPWQRGVSDLLVLPKGVRTIASVTVGGTWDGSAYTGGTVLATTAYRPIYRTLTGEYLALRMVDGSLWTWPAAIDGTWEDTDADTDVPAEITYLANYLAAERFKVEMASAAGQIGPDGSVIPIRNVFRDPLVQKTLDKWRISNEAMVL